VAAPEAGADELPEVSPEEAIALVADGMLLVDVREEGEWDAGHAPDARLLPLPQLQERVAELPADTRFLVVCHSGMRSMRATAFLRSEGLDAVNVTGGMVAWAQAGGALTANATEA
jgi:rhodanese-related sulfurtransferase